jgi:ankyrin repeat protein
LDAVWICCIHGNAELAQLIIESSAAGHTPEPLEIDMRDHRGLTPLNCAAIKGDFNLSKMLIEKVSSIYILNFTVRLMLMLKCPHPRVALQLFTLLVEAMTT